MDMHNGKSAGRPKTGDYVRLYGAPRCGCQYAVLGEREETNGVMGWAAALVKRGDQTGRSSCTSVWLRPRSFKRA